MSSRSNNGDSGLMLALLFMVFMVLKLTGVIGWSWWWVTAPLWGMPVLLLAAFGVFMGGLWIAVKYNKYKADSKRVKIEREDKK